MTRCDYDAVFYRVFCITLLAIAFTFTIILTNVFVDIDGLLSRKEKGKHTGVTEEVHSVVFENDYTTETTNNDEIVYEETDDTYRSKRSLESQNFLFHIENPKVKEILKNKLANLLEDLDVEESIKNYKTNPLRTQMDSEVDRRVKQKEGDMLHLAMHNILLQGIIDHMEFGEVYKRLHNLIKTFKKERTGGIKDNTEEQSSGSVEILKSWKKNGQTLVEDKLFKELVDCKELEDQIVNADYGYKKQNERSNSDMKGPKVLIKTLIDITSSAKEKTKHENESNSKENVKGLVKLVYNGKNIKFSRVTDETTRKPIKLVVKEHPLPVTEKAHTAINKTKVSMYDYKSIPKSYMNKFIEEYFKRFAVKDNESAEKNKDMDKNRTKREIKVKYDNEKAKAEKKQQKGHKPDDDELYVEIETHFDSKGMKGEKKKKLIRNLIQKIQNAIHSDMEDDKKKKDKHLHVKKRIQNPLEPNNKLLFNKLATPISGVIHRQINPMTRMGVIQDSLSHLQDKSIESWKKGNVDDITDKSGENWRKGYMRPGFLTGKSLNSAEMSEVDVDYSKVLNFNGIPQRLQKPINTDTSDELGNTFYDLGNLKFYIKDVDGTGFSIGFNQYVDEPPDTDTIKLFTGLENIVNAYHQTNNQNEQSTDQNKLKLDFEDKYPDLPREDKTDDHTVVRRSIKENHDYHSNEYKIIFENNFLPYGSYQEIYDKQNNDETERANKIREPLPFIIDENIFNKNLNPAEIFGLANLFQRKKRSINVKKISNLKNKMKLNRFLNTRAKTAKRIYMNKKRNKRQINKIRIIASDLTHAHTHSDENIYVVSNENMFADRAIVREVEAPHSENEEYQRKPEEPYEYTNEEESYLTPGKLFDGRSRHNALTSKYPHIFMEEISKSKQEEFGLEHAFLFNKLFERDQDLERNSDTIVNLHTLSHNNNTPEISSRVEELLNNLPPGKSNSNIKVTVKVLPKNGTGLNSGFKEIHTSINKSYNKNGLMYSSLVNVSEISKIMKINKTIDNVPDIEYKAPESELSKSIKEQQEKMQFLLKQHKQHLDDQLMQLKEEKTRLETLLLNSNTTYKIPAEDFVGIVLPSNPHQVLQLTKVRVNEIAARSNTENFTEVGTTTTEAIITEAPPQVIPVPLKPVDDKIKAKMINTIERNENLTYQILNKIDKNTEILQSFLKKLTDTITKTETPKEKVLWNNQPINFDVNHMGQVRKNGTDVSIPFFYAYQQPITPHKPENVASVVYHGHIHTNAMSNDHNLKISEKKSKEYVKSGNETKFFIDNLGNDYKVISVRDVKKDLKTPDLNNTVF